MSWLSKSLNSSLGRKVLMALTGLFLCSFLVIHLIGNLQLLRSDGGEAFNLYAKFMTTNPIIKAVSILLYASILAHALWGILLAIDNKKARPQDYYTTDNQSSWSSRNMAWLGLAILAFIILHMAQFWYVYKWGDIPYKAYPSEYGRALVVKDLYITVMKAFKEEWIVIVYLIGMAVLAYHLIHGFQSAFQSLGLNHKKYTPFIKKFGYAFAVVTSILFAIIPIWVYLDLGTKLFN